MKRTKRLSVLCGELEACTLFADVGCDHGYCTEYMLKNGLCRRAQISDISAESLKKAEDLLASYIERGDAVAIVCAGLEKIDRSTDLVLIAGMGGEEIVKILEEGFLPEKLLLQPMKNADKVRAFLLSKGYGICRDYTFFAEGKFYDVIKACKGAPSAYTEDMILFGGDNLISPRADFLKKLEKEIRLNELWLQEAKEGRENILARLRKLRGIYDETCGRLREN